MSLGVFVQLNEGTHMAEKHPVGYVVQENGCWDWIGALTDDGYGSIWVGGKTHRAHRWVYEREVGPISAGKQLDHLCRNRGCVNPAHLEPVDNRTNALRGVGCMAQNAKKTHCPSGHPLSGANIRRAKDGARSCRICRAEYQRRRAAQKKSFDLGKEGQ